MDGLRYIGISICTVTAATAIFSMLMPAKKLERVLRFSISLFFLIGLISPFFNKKLDFYIPLDDIELSAQAPISSKMDESILSLTQTRLEAELERELFKNKISPVKIKAVISTNHNNGENSISIKQLIVTIEQKDSGNTAMIQEILQNATGCSATVEIK